MIAEPEDTQAQNGRKSQDPGKVLNPGQMIWARLTEDDGLSSMRQPPELFPVLGRSSKTIRIFGAGAKRKEVYLYVARRSFSKDSFCRSVPPNHQASGVARNSRNFLPFRGSQSYDTYTQTARL